MSLHVILRKNKLYIGGKKNKIKVQSFGNNENWSLGCLIQTCYMRVANKFNKFDICVNYK